MSRLNLRAANVRVAYPWQLGDGMPDNVDGLSIDEQIYKSDLVGSFVLGRDVLGSSTFILGQSLTGDTT
ncbi:hypothetical protein [Asaia sp. HN010]|uniref:hypothetical protein n=1 Tax=Asaia sp. HN010 TaxID=3081233 RepID=UPI003018917D